MEKQIKDILPPLNQAVSMQPKDLAVPLLQYLNERIKAKQIPVREYFAMSADVDSWAGFGNQAATRAIMEAWVWLESQGMVAPRPGVGAGIFITREGREFLTHGSPETYEATRALRHWAVDRAVAEKVLPLFADGHYSAAVLEAFKQVEVRVRSAARLPDALDGVKLMRAAFNGDKGPLRDVEADPAERQAMPHLFAGAYGVVRNPAAHRDVDLDDPIEAAELILLANHLLRIVDRRSVPEESGT